MTAALPLPDRRTIMPFETIENLKPAAAPVAAYPDGVRV